MVGGGWHLVPEILGYTQPIPAKKADLQSIFARNIFFLKQTTR